jgi:GT2 family glycosyltransferase
MSPLSPLLSVSIVVYHSDPVLFEATIRTLSEAAAVLDAMNPHTGGSQVVLIDNALLHEARALLEKPDLQSVWARFGAVEVIEGQGNVGYGRGHNLGIAKSRARYHLILNPDVGLHPQALARAVRFLDGHINFGLLAPLVFDENGQMQYLCRRYPSVLDLFVRGFLPRGLRKRFAGRLARYEMRDVIGSEQIVRDPPLISGCFMFFRADILKRAGGFDPRYFLYFEDYDLTLRARKFAAIAYVPEVRIVHHGGGAAQKGLLHVRLFLASAFRFFRKHGWRFF